MTRKANGRRAGSAATAESSAQAGRAAQLLNGPLRASVQAARPTKGERDDLIRLVKQRERLAKTAAKERAASMLAEFERQISAIYSFDDNETWAAAYEAAEVAAKRANEIIANKSAKLGIPKEFAPTVELGWCRRGENAARVRRDELRRLALAEIAAAEKRARFQIETASLGAQTQIIATGLTSDAALAILEGLPTVESLMPPLDARALQAKLSFCEMNEDDD